MSFCTAINCMDGRAQLPVIKYLQQRFGVDNVDSITEPGPNKILAEQTESHLLDSIFQRLQISVQHHYSVGLAVVGHADCAGNPATEQEQAIHTRRAVDVGNVYHLRGLADRPVSVDSDRTGRAVGHSRVADHLRNIVINCPSESLAHHREPMRF